MNISVVIPTLNEQARLPALLEALALADVETVVSDGGSTDATLETARRMGARVVCGPRGRGPQMNAGAHVSSGEILFFLHADALPPPDFKEKLTDAMRDGRVVLGAFRLTIDSPGVPFRLIERAANFRSRIFSMPYADQGFFLRREVFNRLGGFADLPIMEDVDLVRQCRRIGKIRLVDAGITVSARRWLKEGWIRTTLRNILLLGLWRLGVPASRLALLYPPRSD